MKEKITGIVKFKLDPNNLPELTAEQKSRVDSIKDEDIDYSDIPPQIRVQWTRPGALVPIGNKIYHIEMRWQTEQGSKTGS